MSSMSASSKSTALPGFTWKEASFARPCRYASASGVLSPRSHTAWSRFSLSLIHISEPTRLALI
eukprot:12795242-Alexandrium_andersonii.AAC.1